MSKNTAMSEIAKLLAQANKLLKTNFDRHNPETIVGLTNKEALDEALIAADSARSTIRVLFGLYSGEEEPPTFPEQET